MSGASPRKKAFGFGVLRAGLVIERHGRIAWLIAGVIVAVMVYGFFHVSIDRDLRDMFRGETDLYETYVATTAAFVDPENQVLLLVEGDTIATPEVLGRLRDFQLELQLLPDAGSVTSIFSLRTAPDADGRTTALVTDADAGLDPALIAALRAHPILGQNLISADATAMLFVVTHVEPKASLDQHNALIAEVNGLVASELAGTGLQTTVTGFAALRTEIVRLLKRDQLVLNGSGAVIGLILSLLLFRSFVGAFITALPGALGALALIGWNGAFGVPVTILSNVVPALIMVIGYADGMHMTSAFRRFRGLGLSVAHAERHALAEVGPACVLSAMTTIVAFLSMYFSDVRILRDFAIIGSIGTFFGTWIVILGHLMITRALGRFWKVGAGVPASPLEFLAAPIVRLCRWVIPRAWPISILSVPLTLALGTLFFLVPPENSVRETLPANSASTQALNVIDSALGGAFPIQIVVPLPADPLAPESLARIEAVHEALAAVPGIASPPLSLWSLAAWLGDGPEPIAARLAAVLDELPDEARRRFLGTPGALVTVNIRETTTAETNTIIDRIETAVHRAAPDAVVTGATVVSAREATRTINNLSTSFASAIAIALVLMAIALRSAGVGIVAAIPNVLPIAATGTLLFFLGTGMQITSVVSLTIAFGIAVDDTIHYLNLLLRQRSRDLNGRLLAAARDIGPVLVGTTLVIVVGLSMTLTSGLATVQQFGLLAVVTLIVAMLGDLIISPALIAGPFRRLFEAKPAVTPAGEETAAAQTPSSAPGE